MAPHEGVEIATAQLEHLHQYVVVVPSERLVLARFGASHGPDGDIEGIGRLVADVTGALRTHS